MHFSLSLVFFLWVVIAKSASSVNPFVGQTFYVTDMYYSEVESSIEDYPSDASLLERAQNVSTAFWIDEMSKIDELSGVLKGAQAQQALALIVVYDLPDRDCAAEASNGEITCQDDACAQGIETYETQYVDPLVATLREYPDVTVVAVIEPDSLPNLATNLGVPKCQQAETAYKTCVSYAIKELSQVSNVALYVDAAHGGWLGWQSNQDKFAAIIVEVLQDAGGPQTIRGFATNTANYQPLGSVSDNSDPCNLESQGNQCVNEVKYAVALDATMQENGITGKGYIIDTSRNGVTDERSDCSDWCNIRGAGLGQRPLADPQSLTGTELVDALVWVKVPGESDGTSNSSSPRFDSHCVSQDSVQPAPEAGQWFSSYFLALCQNAVPPL